MHTESEILDVLRRRYSCSACASWILLIDTARLKRPNFKAKKGPCRSNIILPEYFDDRKLRRRKMLKNAAQNLFTSASIHLTCLLA